MENKKAKVKTRDFYRENTYQGKPQYQFFVTFEGDTVKHLYTSSVKEPKYFTPGEEQEYTYEHKKGVSNGTEWEMHIVKPVYPKKGFGFGGSSQLTLQEFADRKKIDSVNYSMSYAKDLVADKAISIDKMSQYAKQMLEWQITQIDKLMLK